MCIVIDITTNYCHYCYTIIIATTSLIMIGSLLKLYTPSTPKTLYFNDFSINFPQQDHPQKAQNPKVSGDPLVVWELCCMFEVHFSMIWSLKISMIQQCSCQVTSWKLTIRCCFFSQKTHIGLHPIFLQMQWSHHRSLIWIHVNVVFELSPLSATKKSTWRYRIQVATHDNHQVVIGVLGYSWFLFL